MKKLIYYPIVLFFGLLLSFNTTNAQCVNCNGFSTFKYMIVNNSAFMHGRVAMGNMSTSAQLTVHNNSSAQYAGYFMGNLHHTGTLSGPSDIKLKKDIKPIGNALSAVLKLNGKNYEYKNEEYKSMNLSEGLQYGFIAQDVEKVFPALVEEVDQKISSIDEEGYKKGEKDLSYKGVNYIGFIPLLTEAIKEQQNIITKQNTELQELKTRILALETATQNRQATETVGAVLMQNNPNPFSEVTNIRYELPEGVQTANMIVHDLQGRQVKEYKVDKSGLLVIKAGELEAGMYLYSLVVNRNVVSTLKMLLTK